MRNRDDFSHYKVINMIHVHCNFLLERIFDICKMFTCFDTLHPSQQFFSHVWMGLPGLNQY